MDIGGGAFVGRVVGVGGQQAQPRPRGVVAGRAHGLDALDDEAVAVPEHEELAEGGHGARGVDDEAVALVIAS